MSIFKKIRTHGIAALLIASLVLCTAALAWAAPTAAKYPLGDINMDEKLDALDVMLFRKHILDELELNEIQLILADANCDGQLSAVDLMIMRKMMQDEIVAYPSSLPESSQPVTSEPTTSEPDPPDPVEEAAFLEESGLALMELVQRDCWRQDNSGANEYVDRRNRAFLWPYGAYLEALASVNASRPSDQEARSRYIAALAAVERYNTGRSPDLSYAASFGGGGDVYYDDNMWIVISFLKAYRQLGDPAYLEKAKKNAAYCYSGWDDVQDGGIYWCEDTKSSKNTCSNAPMAMVSADLYQETGDAFYLDWAKRIYAWTRQKLMDPSDGLYWDNIDLEGNVDTRKYSYNTGCMLSAAVELYKITGEQSYLDDAKRTAASAHTFFLSKMSSGYYRINDANPWFNTWLNEGFQRLYKIDPEAGRYLDHMASAVANGYHTRNAEGYVYAGWEEGRGGTTAMIDQAGTIRILMELSRYAAERDASRPPESEILDESGLALLSLIQEDCWRTDNSGANEYVDAGDRASLWSHSAYLETLAAVNASHPSDQAARSRYVAALAALENYNTGRAELSYSTAYGGQGDVYYGDNVWIAAAYLKAYRQLGDPAYFDKAKKTASYCYSGWDDKLGGGIYWMENVKNYKNTCSNAPIALASAGLYQETGDTVYLDWAKKIYAWTKQKFMDPSDGLYWDNIDMSGTINQSKYSYNSGCMLSAAVELYNITGEQSYLNDAKRTAASAEAYFLQRSEAGYYTIKDANPGFIAWLNDGFLRLYQVDPAAGAYLDHMISAVTNGYDTRNQAGYVYAGWDANKGGTNKMIDQTGTVRVLLELSRYAAEREADLQPRSASLDKSGVALMSLIQRDCWRPDNLGANEYVDADGHAFLWPYSAYLEALASVNASHPSDQTARNRYIAALAAVERYNTGWSPDLSYAPAFGGGGDVYYDDNMWTVISFLKAYRQLGDPAYLEKAKRNAAYCYSGWDDVLGGGIYWRENKDSKNTCSNAPMAMVSADLYRVTGDAFYLDWARRIYAWTRQKLMDPSDGLYWDNINLQGSVIKNKYSCNAGNMISAAVELYKITGEQSYLNDAKRTAASADAYFLSKTSSGAYRINNTDPWFNAWLNEGFLRLYPLDPTAGVYLEHMISAVTNGYHTRASTGYVYSGWDTNSGVTNQMIDQAGTVRIFMELSRYTAEREVGA